MIEAISLNKGGQYWMMEVMVASVCTSLIGTRHRLDRVSLSWDHRSGTKERAEEKPRQDRVVAEMPLWAGLHEKKTGRRRLKERRWRDGRGEGEL